MIELSSDLIDSQSYCTLQLVYSAKLHPLLNAL